MCQESADARYAELLARLQTFMPALRAAAQPDVDFESTWQLVKVGGGRTCQCAEAAERAFQQYIRFYVTCHVHVTLAEVCDANCTTVLLHLRLTSICVSGTPFYLADLSCLASATRLALLQLHYSGRLEALVC
jgi:hypothetical protein